MLDRLKRKARTRAAVRRYLASVPSPAKPEADGIAFEGRGSAGERARLTAALVAEPEAAFAAGPALRAPTSRSAPLVVEAAGWELGMDGEERMPQPIGAGLPVEDEWATRITWAGAPAGTLVARRRGDSRPQGLTVWSVPSVGSPLVPPVRQAEALRRRDAGLGTVATLQAGPPSAPPPAARWVGELPGHRSPGVDGPGPTPRVAIRHAATDWSVASGWGDHHFAAAMAVALDELGVGGRVVARHAWSTPFAARDVVVTLRGLHAARPVDGRFNVLWVISHPADVRQAELDAYDLVAVASVPDAARMSQLTSTPVVPLLQASRSSFARKPLEQATGVVFVGNSRGVLRPTVRAAIESGIDFALFGTGWDGLLPDDREAGDPIPNATLPDTLNGFRLVLADHWDDMRERGYVANRIFDTYAAGSLPVSDPVEGLEELFPGTPVHDGDLAAVVASWGGRDQERARLVERHQDDVLSHHTFAHRARQLLEAIAERGGPDLLP